MKTHTDERTWMRGNRRLLWTIAACLALTAPFGVARAQSVPAQQCLTDLKTFDAQLRDEGYWLDGAGYGYGYPVYGYGYSYGSRYPEPLGFGRARTGYELRTLLATARIFANNGQQQPCETVLSGAREVYSTYATELRKGQIPQANASDWRRQQIESAVAVTDDGLAHRADQLIGTSLVNNRNDSLGEVEDIVMSPQTGKIAYLVIGHGGLWGIDEKYTPVPWSDFRSATLGNLLVLPVTESILAGAPQVKKDASEGTAEFAAQSRKVDAYWAAHATRATK